MGTTTMLNSHPAVGIAPVAADAEAPLDPVLTAIAYYQRISQDHPTDEDERASERLVKAFDALAATTPTTIGGMLALIEHQRGKWGGGAEEGNTWYELVGQLERGLRLLAQTLASA